MNRTLIDQMPQAEAEQLLAELGAVLTGHFVGTSDKHLQGYVDKDVPIRHPRAQRRLAIGMAALVQGMPVDVVVSPPMGAIVLGSNVAEALDVEYAFLEMVTQQFGMTRGLRDEPVAAHYNIGLAVKRQTFKEAVCGKRVGIGEDILTTGKTTLQTIEAVRKAGGEVVWVLALYNRGAVTAQQLGVEHLLALVERQLLVMTPEECADWGPCSESVPVSLAVGHGARYMRSNPDYVGGFC